jgi:hypothetical protein
MARAVGADIDRLFHGAAVDFYGLEGEGPR